MESKNELKEIDIKNRTCYYFDDVIKDIDINFTDILLDEKSCGSTSVYDISNNNFNGSKTIRFHKIDGFVRVHGGEFRYLVLFDCLIKFVLRLSIL